MHVQCIEVRETNCYLLRSASGAALIDPGPPGGAETVVAALVGEAFMNLYIRPMRSDDVEDLVQLGLLAWEPVFASFRRVLGPDIYHAIWPEWRTSQREGIEGVCRDSEKMTVWVAEVDGAAVGFLAYELDSSSKEGEVMLLAVHPDYQNHGVGTELNCFALERMKESGMEMAKAETGGDPSHAPARRSYEKAGYTALPLVRYFKKL